MLAPPTPGGAPRDRCRRAGSPAAHVGRLRSRASGCPWRSHLRAPVSGSDRPVTADQAPAGAVQVVPAPERNRRALKQAKAGADKLKPARPKDQRAQRSRAEKVGHRRQSRAVSRPPRAAAWPGADRPRRVEYLLRHAAQQENRREIDGKHGDRTHGVGTPGMRPTPDCDARCHGDTEDAIDREPRTGAREPQCDVHGHAQHNVADDGGDRGPFRTELRNQDRPPTSTATSPTASATAEERTRPRPNSAGCQPAITKIVIAAKHWI